MLGKLTILFFLISSLGYSQRFYKLTVEINGEVKTLPFISRNTIDFVSSKEIARLLSANYFYNNETAKSEIKFEEKTIKFTAKSQFVIVAHRLDKSQHVIQLPAAPLYYTDDVLIPIVFVLDYLGFCYGKKIEYNDRTKRLSVTSESFDESKLFINQQLVPPISQQEIADSPEAEIKKSGYDIYDVSVEDKVNGTLIRLRSNKKVSIPRNSIGNGTLFVFLPNISVAPGIDKKINSIGLVKNVKLKLLPSKITQLEFLLNEGYSTSEVLIDEPGNDILITIHNKVLNPVIEENDPKSKWTFDCVVIDAGHGGKDPGAIGVTGVREKDINLAVALKLGDMIEKQLPTVKVVYTRKTDEFVELYRRGKIANENDGKLFISIHCNSTEAKDIAHRGFEVYLLRPGRTNNAIKIAEFENSVIKYEENPQRYQKLTDENFILVSMAHSQYMRFSEKYSDLLNEDWKRFTEVPSLGIKQAGFYVLVGASMPGVLIETGFLSNRKDEAYLKSSKGQTDIASAILNAVKRYKDYYDKQITN